MRRSPGRLALVVAVGCGGAQPTTVVQDCPADRIVEIASQEDVAAFAGCRTAAGITIRTGAPLELSPLRELESIAGDLSIGPTVAVEALDLAGVRTIGGALEVASNTSLRAVILPRLTAARRVSIESNAALSSISMPRLARVTGSLVITGNSDLEIADLSALATIGEALVVAGNSKLMLLELDQLTGAGSVRIEANRALPVEEANALRSKAPAP